MHLDDADMAMPTFTMGLSNVIVSRLPARFSRWFPLVPIGLGFAYAFIRSAGSMAERFARAMTGAVAIAQYSVVRNVAGTKPADAPAVPKV